MRRLTPVQALLHILRDEGVDRIFGNPGTTELPLLDALVDAQDLTYVLGLHEGPVVAMADGYARATGRPAFVNLHVAAGVANGLIGMLNARRSRTPLVVTAGQQDRRHLLSDPMLSGDLVGLARAATKSAVEVQHARDLPLLLRRAFAEARRPPAGPVFLAIPMDILEEDIDIGVPERSPTPPPALAGGLDAAVALLRSAERPVIVAGDGVGRDGAVDQLVAVAEALGASVYHQPMADSINFPGDHPLYHGMLRPTNADIRARLEPFDVAFIVGTHAFMAHHYAPDEPIPDGTEIVQLDADPAEPGRNFPVRAALVGGLVHTLAELARRLRSEGPAAGKAAVDAAARRAAVDADALAQYGSFPLAPLAAMHAVANALPADAVVVEEAITAGLLLREVLRQRRPGSYVHTVGGGLGWGIGAAIGTSLGHRDRPVVAVLGDGCAAFGLQGLWSAARFRVPVTLIVVNNGEYRTLKDTLDHNKSLSTARGHYLGLDLTDPGLDWSAAGRTFGVPTVRVESCEHLAAVVADAPNRDGPLLVDVPVTGYSQAVPSLSLSRS